MKKRKRESVVGMQLTNQECIRTFREKENKYLGILEVDTIKQAKMRKNKERVSQTNEKTLIPNSVAEIS